MSLFSKLMLGLLTLLFMSQSQACEYLLQLDSVVPMDDLQGLQKIKVQVGLPSNKNHHFFAIENTAMTSQSVSKKGMPLGLQNSAKPVSVNMDQIIELQKLAGANKGLQINVLRQNNLTKQFLKDASHLFLNLGAGQMLLQETNFTPAAGQGEHGFDPRDLRYDGARKAYFAVQNSRIQVNFSVTEVSSCR